MPSLRFPSIGTIAVTAASRVTTTSIAKTIQGGVARASPFSFKGFQCFSWFKSFQFFGRVKQLSSRVLPCASGVRCWVRFAVALPTGRELHGVRSFVPLLCPQHVQRSLPCGKDFVSV